jgi:hypothetical protein
MLQKKPRAAQRRTTYVLDLRRKKKGGKSMRTDVSSLEEFLRGFVTFGMIVHVIEYIVHNA